MKSDLKEKLEELMEALKEGGYDTKPSKLLQGSISYVKSDDTALTDEELDQLQEATYPKTND